jgi:hypothetical protein
VSERQQCRLYEAIVAKKVHTVRLHTHSNLWHLCNLTALIDVDGNLGVLGVYGR